MPLKLALTNDLADNLSGVRFALFKSAEKPFVEAHLVW